MDRQNQDTASPPAAQGQRKKWKNQYIDLIALKTRYVVPGAREGLREDQISRLRELGGDYGQIYCEIGCGSGEHLAELAARRPSALYIGFELRFKRAFSTAKKAERLGLQNLVVVRSNAALLPAVFPPGSITGIYINFPDPWERQKWKKHRLLTQGFASALAQTLVPHGFLSYKTDHRDNFEAAKKLFTADGLFKISKETDNLYASPYSAENIKSEFEKLFLSKGLAIHFMELERIPANTF